MYACMYVYINIFVHLRVLRSAYAHAYMNECMYTNICLSPYKPRVHMRFTCANIHVFAFIYTCLHTCAYAHVHPQTFMSETHHTTSCSHRRIPAAKFSRKWRERSPRRCCRRSFMANTWRSSCLEVSKTPLLCMYILPIMCMSKSVISSLRRQDVSPHAWVYGKCMQASRSQGINARQLNYCKKACIHRHTHTHTYIHTYMHTYARFLHPSSGSNALDGGTSALNAPVRIARRVAAAPLRFLRHVPRHGQARAGLVARRVLRLPQVVCFPFTCCLYSMEIYVGIIYESVTGHGVKP